MEVIWLVGIRLSLVSPCSPPYSVRSVMSPLSFLMLVIWVFSVFFLSQSSWTFNNFIGRLFKETGFPGGAGGKEPDCQRTDVKDLPSLGREDPLEEGVAVRSGVLAWRVPWTEEPGGLRSAGCLESPMDGGARRAAVSGLPGESHGRRSPAGCGQWAAVSRQ